MKIQISKDQTIETDNYTMDELIEVSDAMQDNIDRMQLSIHKAKSEQQATGEYSDINWWNNVHYALKITRRNAQRIIRVIAVKKKALAAKANKENREERLRFERVFVSSAKHLLLPETFQEIIDEVNYRLRQEGF